MALTALKKAMPQDRYIKITSTYIGTPEITDRDFGGMVFTEKASIFINGVAKDFAYDKMVEVYNAEQARKYFGSDADETEIASQYFGYRSPRGFSPRRLVFVRKDPNENPVDALARINGLTNNFGGFMFVDSAKYTVEQMEDVVKYIDTLNNKYEFALSFPSEAKAKGSSATASALIGNTNARDFVTRLAHGEALPSYAGTSAWLGHDKLDEGSIRYFRAKYYVEGEFCFYKTPAQGATPAVVNVYKCLSAYWATATNGDNPDADSVHWEEVEKYDPEGTYAVGDICAYDNEVYKMTKAYGQDEEKDTPDEAPAHWEMVEYVNGENSAIAAFMPLAIFGSVRYDGNNTVTNYMFKQFPSQVFTVDDEMEADEYDALCVNYIGLVQANGGRKAFSQQGYNINGEAINTYANECWMKSEVSTALLNLFLDSEIVDAEDEGELLVYNTISSAALKAKNNGTISVGKTLDDAQKTAIYQFTQDNEAWRTVQDAGYWLNVDIRRVTEQGKTFYKAFYLLVYSKDDAILKVEGTHALV